MLTNKGRNHVMLNWFKPTWLVDSIYHVSPARLKCRGIKAVFSDLDNTLLAWNHAQGTLSLKRLASRFQRHRIRLVVISNNTTSRVSRALSGLHINYISWSLKPLPLGILRALKRYRLKRDQVVMVGDQLLTDVWAANNAHVRSMWVKPLVKTDQWDTRINRFFERRIKVRLERRYNLPYWRE